MFKIHLKEGERLLSLVRQTELVLAKPATLILLLIYLPWYFALKYELASQFSWLLLGWTILVFIYGLNRYLLWLLNAYILTNDRLIIIYHHTVFKKEIRETPIDHIASISYKTGGFLSSLFKYGNVEVMVVNLNNPMVIKNARNPGDLKDYLWKVRRDSPLARLEDASQEIKGRENHEKIEKMRDGADDESWPEQLAASDGNEKEPVKEKGKMMKNTQE